jgi:hypothetical protein
MSATDKKTDEEGDEILRRMLKTPPQPKEDAGREALRSQEPRPMKSGGQQNKGHKNPKK